MGSTRPDESCVFLERLRRESWCNMKTPREFCNIKDVGVADSMDHESYVSLRQYQHEEILEAPGDCCTKGGKSDKPICR